MNKFNLPRRNIARERRLKRTERRKLASAGSSSATRPTASKVISGKKQRKLVKKWRQAQRNALESGLVTMQDIEMMVAEGEAGGSEEAPKVKSPKNKRVFNVKRRAKMRLKLAGSSNKGKTTTEATSADHDGDTMMQ
ncbi:hypothetical protein MPTK1_5g17680 [Marchantia polymorpha subsp. ruderalis]|uniref:Uncharacterized protein n=2 Tax=Marchantia polymorpha TaxID=3197 RepID=A0A176W6P3_MARPO|nr:hypothetical protein AXG93_4027s1150 [Marchantia polymorpha subsp. ruderalis]PTQ33925.1 hypothetical protein MARPO_0084s0018 [Marchantia polymorpha]PTQ33926.1 hypothetical protein MARPO_0084s0018 [Marchantia polymorpha]BBN12137.1 hypothetical protein Mp_5g17680 [Marchantia polymorpha subsp. ruderalis]BBN12138.1 hypothetical protein Mp_5g17680 [Marchantia polymorpha subsp. ruderalis]|eukprot:PTQ33925.1 hypothetical protein MARPO_0084s0018 [Marchantia polymorpha]